MINVQEVRSRVCTDNSLTAGANLVTGLFVQGVPSSPPKERCRMTILSKSIVNEGEFAMVGVDCGRWNCKKCGPRLKEKWLRHLSAKLNESLEIYVSQIVRAQWETLRKRIVRMGGNYAHIRLVSGVWVVFADVPEGTLVADDVLIILQTAMDSVAYDRKPIASSRGWRLPKNNMVPDKKKWERVSKILAPVEEVKKAAVSAGVIVSPMYYYNGTTIFYYKIPVTWDEAKVEAFNLMLRSLGDKEQETGVGVLGLGRRLVELAKEEDNQK